MTRSAAALAALALLIVGGTALGGAPQKITKSGVGELKLGMTAAEARDRGLVGRMQRGCELGGPDTRGAALKRPLKGTVNYTERTPRRVRDITITGGAAARGVGIGDRIKDIKAAYPNAKVDHSTDETFRLTLVKVGKRGGGPLRFGVDVDTKRITLIGVPYIAFCE